MSNSTSQCSSNRIQGDGDSDGDGDGDGSLNRGN